MEFDTGSHSSGKRVHVSSNTAEERERERERGGREREGERERRGGEREGVGRKRKKLIPRITKNKARVDGKLFSNGLRQGLSSYVIYRNLARSFAGKHFPRTRNFGRK